MKTIKGFAITPPTLGSIRIGKTISKGDRKLPQKDDAFSITTLVQGDNGWIAHRLHDEVMKTQAPAREGAQQKIRAIPVRVMFDDPDLNLRAEYSAFDPLKGRPLCAGDGDKARRRTANGIESVDCPGSDNCAYGKEKRCKLYARMNVQIDGQDDELGTFVFRTTGFNSVRTLSARLSYLHALTGGKLAGLPLSLRIRAKTTSNSYKSVVYFVDLQVREGMSLVEACRTASEYRQAWEAIGLNRVAFEAAARDGFERSAFEDSEDDAGDVIDEFYSAPEHGSASPNGLIDEDGVIHPAQVAANRQRAPQTATASRPAGGLAGLRVQMDVERESESCSDAGDEKFWSVPFN
ncbi:MAG: hydrolase or metal-binding protein [Rhodocyclaceae bacterium]|nr:hydrolase or metal-binding protein [Rhodocyclaceae bacterium]